MLKGIRTFVGVVLLALFLFPVVARAQSGRTFYIDYTPGVGSNSNNGTSKSMPWKTHPYMQSGASCTVSGSAPIYSPVAGDQFIFKGGVTWPPACFTMFINSGGTSSAQTYYGVDKTWFVGTAWTRPLWDMNHVVVQNVVWANSGVTGYLTFDNIEIAHQGIPLVAGEDQAAFFLFFGHTGTILENMYIHDWTTTGRVHVSTSPSDPNQNISYDDGGIFSSNNTRGSNPSLINSIISDQNGWFFNSAGTQIFGGWGGACMECNTISGSTFHDVSAACFDHLVCHDSLFYNIDAVSIGNYDGGINGIHTQAIEDDGGGTSVNYNNYLHDINAGVTVLICAGSSFYNNVITNTRNGQYPLFIDTNGCNSTATATELIYNNTIDGTEAGGGCVELGRVGATIGTVIMKNNIFITPGGFCTVLQNATITSFTNSNLAQMGASEANANGFTENTLYFPTQSDSNVVGQGANLSSSCSGNLLALCSDAEGAPWFGGLAQPRPTSGNWTLGLYVPGSNAPAVQFAPTSIGFGTQSTGTQSPSQTAVLTNSGTAPLAISGISVTGTNPSDFVLTPVKNCPSSLAAGASCNIPVAFAPTANGSRSANISVADNAPGSPQTVPLTGTGGTILWTYVEGTTAPGKCSSAASCSIVLPAAPATGQTVWVAFGMYNNGSGATLSSVKDCNNNSYTLTTQSPSPLVANAGQGWLAYLLSAPSNACATITVTFTGTIAQIGIPGADVAQVASGYTPTFDHDAINAGTETGTAINTPTFTPAVAQEFVETEVEPVSAITSPVGSPWTTDTIFEPTIGAPYGWANGYVINQTAQLASGPNMTDNASGGWSSIIGGIEAVPTGSTPTISSLSVTSGNEGASVTITGSNFGSTQSTSTVTLNGAAVSVTSWGAGSIGITIPTPGTTGNIVVTVSSVVSNGVLFTVTPHLTSLSVTTGTVGTSVTATGTGFGATQGPSTMTFNGTACSPSAWSDSGVTCTVPAAATTGNVNVTQGGNASNSISFTVMPEITSLSPTSGVVGAGVTITGTTFGTTQNTSTVKFNGTTATCTSWSSTSLSCSVPSGATTGNVVVNVSGNNSNGISFTVNAPVSTPVIASVTPNVGLAGTTVTITGSNFGSTQSTSTVSFNGVIAAVTSWSATQIVCNSPATATTGNILVTVSSVASNAVPYGVYAFPFIIIR